MIVAAWALLRKQKPGVSLNLYVGVPLLVGIIMALTDFHSADFMLWFLLFYSLTLWIVLLWVAIKYTVLPIWQDELLTWTVAPVSLTFFAMIHWALEVPWGAGEHSFLNWIAYAVIILLQIVASFVVLRSLPTALGAIGLFVISVKISSEVTELA